MRSRYRLFTVALFVASVAFPPGGIQDAAKMGALASFGAAFLTIISGKVLRVQKVEGAPAGMATAINASRAS